MDVRRVVQQPVINSTQTQNQVDPTKSVQNAVQNQNIENTKNTQNTNSQAQKTGNSEEYVKMLNEQGVAQNVNETV
jgi:predicted transcriptional regulator YheO